MSPPRSAFLPAAPTTHLQNSSFLSRTLQSSSRRRQPPVVPAFAPRATYSPQIPQEDVHTLHEESVKHLKSLKSKRVPTFRKLQRRHKEGPAAFRQAQQAQEILSENLAAEITQPPPHLAKKTPRRHMLRDAIELSQLKVGMQLVGQVRNLVRHGAYVDIGAIRDGLVHIRDMSTDFIHSPSDVVRSGDTVTVWVKYVNTVTNVLGLSMLKPTRGFVERMPVHDIEIGKRYEGIVERVTNYGAYIDIGAERLAFLHVSAIWGRRPRQTLEYLRIGQKLWAHVDDVDEIRSHIKLRARGKGHRELKENNPLGGLAQLDDDSEEEKGGPEVVIRQAVARPWDDDDEEEDETAQERVEDEDFEDMYEREVDEDDMFATMELLPDDVTKMINESDDYYDITDFQAWSED